KAGRFLLCQTKINVTADDSLCNLDDTVSSSGLHYFLFVLGQLIAGAGATPLHTLGPAYLDDNVHPQYIGIYFGVFYLTVFLGPGLGSILGGKLLGIWIDLNVVSCRESCGGREGEHLFGLAPVNLGLRAPKNKIFLNYQAGYKIIRRLIFDRHISIPDVCYNILVFLVFSLNKILVR
ncbi:predicted protein, partial [Nematostella vectensis]